MERPHFHVAVVAAALASDARQAPRVARTLGFDGLLFDACSPALNLPDLSQSGRREFRHVLAAENRQLIGLRMGLGPNGLSPGVDVDHILSQVTKAMEAAAGLQAPLLCADLGPLPAPPAGPTAVKRVTPEMAGLILLPPSAVEPPPPALAAPAAQSAADLALAAQVDAVLVELGARADRFSVTVAFRSELASFAALDRAVTRAACPWFVVDLDPVGVLRDEWTMDEVFSRLGPSIRHVRGRDASSGAGGRTSPAAMGAGSTRWPELLSNLDASGYHGWITVDPMELPDRIAAALTGLKVLRPQPA